MPHYQISATAFHFLEFGVGSGGFHALLPIQAKAVLLENGADTQNRTGDLILTKDALYRLSHISTLTGKDHAQCVI